MFSFPMGRKHPAQIVKSRRSMKVGDLVKNRSALGQARGALGIVLSVIPNLGDAVIAQGDLLE